MLPPDAWNFLLLPVSLLRFRKNINTAKAPTATPTRPTPTPIPACAPVERPADATSVSFDTEDNVAVIAVLVAARFVLVAVVWASSPLPSVVIAEEVKVWVEEDDVDVVSLVVAVEANAVLDESNPMVAAFPSSEM